MDHNLSSMRKDIKKRLLQYSISLNEELGQYFIYDSRLLIQETKYAKISKKHTVIEIGPGIGNLTEILARRAKRVITIEKDTQFDKVLSELQKKYSNIDVIYDDALNVDFPKFDKVISNLPFKIALPLIFKILKYRFDVAILVCQLKLANRICAKPGQKGYSRIGVQISRVSKAEILKIIPPRVFYPSPNVTSAIIRIKKTKPKFDVPSDDFFMEVLKFLFAIREKTLQDALFSLAEVGISWSKLRKVKTLINKTLLRKPIYTVSPKEFGKVTQILWDKLGKGIIKYFYSFYKLKNLYNKKK